MWASEYPTNLHKLYMLQKRAIRIISQVKWRHNQSTKQVNVRRGWFTGIELVLDPTTWVHFLSVTLDSIV